MYFPNRIVSQSIAADRFFEATFEIFSCNTSLQMVPGSSMDSIVATSRREEDEKYSGEVELHRLSDDLVRISTTHSYIDIDFLDAYAVLAAMELPLAHGDNIPAKGKIANFLGSNEKGESIQLDIHPRAGCKIFVDNENPMSFNICAIELESGFRMSQLGMLIQPKQVTLATLKPEQVSLSRSQQLTVSAALQILINHMHTPRKSP